MSASNKFSSSSLICFVNLLLTSISKASSREPGIRGPRLESLSNSFKLFINELTSRVVPAIRFPVNHVFISS